MKCDFNVFVSSFLSDLTLEQFSHSLSVFNTNCSILLFSLLTSTLLCHITPLQTLLFCLRGCLREREMKTLR